MRDAISVEKRVAAAVWKMATGDSYQSVARQFGIGRCTAGKIFMEVCVAIEKLLFKRVVRLGDVGQVSPYPALPQGGDTSVPDYMPIGHRSRVSRSP